MNFSRRCLRSSAIPKNAAHVGKFYRGSVYRSDSQPYSRFDHHAKACAGRNIQLQPIQRRGADYHSTEKLWLTLPRPVYVITGRIQLLWLKVCPMQIFSNESASDLGRLFYSTSVSSVDTSRFNPAFPSQ